MDLDARRHSTYHFGTSQTGATVLVHDSLHVPAKRACETGDVVPQYCRNSSMQLTIVDIRSSLLSSNRIGEGAMHLRGVPGFNRTTCFVATK